MKEDVISGSATRTETFWLGVNARYRMLPFFSSTETSGTGVPAATTSASSLARAELRREISPRSRDERRADIEGLKHERCIDAACAALRADPTLLPDRSVIEWSGDLKLQ